LPFVYGYSMVVLTVDTFLSLRFLINVENLVYYFLLVVALR